MATTVLPSAMALTRPRIVTTIGRALNRILDLLGTGFVLGLSLLPLSALLLAYPAIAPQESVLRDAVSSQRSWWRRTADRVFAIFTSMVVLIALLAIAVEVVTRLPLPAKGSFGIIAETLLPAPEIFLGRTSVEREARLAVMPEGLRGYFTTPLHEKLPPAMVQHWPFVILTIYLLDVLLLLFIGKVPLAYNIRNVLVRWKTNLMTAVAFTCVIALLTFLLAFVNGMNNLTQNSGIPGNVFVLSDGATDELFSNLGYGELDNVERVVVTTDQQDRPLAVPVRVRREVINGREVYLASKQTYYVINMPVPNSNPPRRRFVQLRTLEDAAITERVHNVRLYPGGRWFSESGVDDQSRIECVLGEGVATTLGADLGKARLQVGDTFSMGEMDWIVTGIMQSEGTTFGSEVWARRFNRITKPFGKENYTTLVLRAEPDTKEASEILAYHLSNRYTQQKLKAFSEPEYYAALTKTNNTFLVAVVIVAVVMAIGGVFGMMTTMFASIAQRICDIGVLRLLGFKRWQVMVSFMLESLAVAAAGGILGCFLAWLIADGRTSTSNLSSGGGGPGGKTVAVTIAVDAEVIALGMFFTLAMGRLGGLVPALSAMRLKVLDSLR
jgi:putative ABC transport system permease protein